MKKYPQAWKLTAAEAPAALPKWWTSMSPESREEYVAEHPNSKYADLHRADPTGGHEDSERDPKASLPKPKASLPELQPSSPIRKKISAFMRKKSTAIVSHLKKEAKEWQAAGSALKGLAHGKALDDHGKKALASVAADIAAVTAAVVLTGGAAHGIAAFLQHFGSHLAQEAMLKAAVKGVIHSASILTIGAGVEEPMDRIVAAAVKALTDTIESGDLQSLMGKKVESRIDMSAEVAGRGLCPECKKPMILALAGPSTMWVCEADRISIPVPDGYETQTASA